MMKLKITQTKGLVGTKKNQRETIRTLGLHKIHQSVVREDTPIVRGMIRAVAHLVTVEEVE
ncbi:MAG: 50S ribosomal protein L30 [Actinomycetales bacterium]|nr:MAG: 50S ribosomal protein L30 [Actinomycetales bacterium]